MNGFLCKFFGHKWRATGGDTERFYVFPPYRRTLTATCCRCGLVVTERRWAFMPEAGALHYICGIEVPDTHIRC